MVCPMANESPFGAPNGLVDRANPDIGLPVAIDPRYHDAVLFDLDGVITDTASLHEAAWAQMFDEYLHRRAGSDAENHDAFTPADYRHFIDGKPRYDGVRDFLASRGISLPWGSPTDEAEDTVCGLGNRKQRLYLAKIAEGVPTFESTVALVRQLNALGVGTAVYSASRNCAAVLESAGIDGLFAVRVDGVTAERTRTARKARPRGAARDRPQVGRAARPVRGRRGCRGRGGRRPRRWFRSGHRRRPHRAERRGPVAVRRRRGDR